MGGDSPVGRRVSSEEGSRGLGTPCAQLVGERRCQPWAPGEGVHSLSCASRGFHFPSRELGLFSVPSLSWVGGLGAGLGRQEGEDLCVKAVPSPWRLRANEAVIGSQRVFFAEPATEIITPLKTW